MPKMERKKLIKLLNESAILHGEFKLRSGRTSNYYIDKYKFLTKPDILNELAKYLVEHTTNIDCIAGAELGGVPLATATSLYCGISTAFIRNQKKEYGSEKQLEGELKAGNKVLLLEDVATTGGQILEAAKVIEAAGAKVVKILSVVDREEGSRDSIEQAGYTYESLFTKTDLGVE